MKKNLISVMILALVLVNLVLTAILTFTIVPQTKKSNELINRFARQLIWNLRAETTKILQLFRLRISRYIILQIVSLSILQTAETVRSIMLYFQLVCL